MSYSIRLIEVCLAAFFLMNLGLELAARAASPWVVRRAERMRAATGARVLLGLRLLPAMLTAAVVLGCCVPSYLRYEHDARESVGLLCALLAACGLAAVSAGAARLVWGLTVSAQLVKKLRRSGRPVFALVGFVRPRVIVSSPIREALSPTQMEAALRHEAAHRSSGDNLKRLALVATPRSLPLSWRKLERGWARLAERAADDAATAGEPRRAIALAEALVCVARLTGQIEDLVLASSLVAKNAELDERVGRLLAASTGGAATAAPSRRWLVAAATLMLAVAVWQQQAVLYGVHCAMERLVR